MFDLPQRVKKAVKDMFFVISACGCVSMATSYGQLNNKVNTFDISMFHFIQATHEVTVLI